MKKIILFSVVLYYASLLTATENKVAITIYNNNLALVKDIRTLEISKGQSKIEFTDVSASIDPTSVHFKSLTAPDAVSILEQNYEYDLVNAEKILDKYIDKEITVFTEHDGPFKGKLLNSSSKNITVQMPEGNLKIISMKSIINVDFPKLPDGLITKPTLVWTLENQNPGNHNTEVSYLTSGIKWHAEYVAVSKKEDTILELSSWVSIDNKSGTDYKNAKLKLVAGEVNRAKDIRPRSMLMKDEAVTFAAAKPQFEEKAFFEYHIYTLQRTTTLNNNQIKQISLFPTSETKAEKLYIYEGATYANDVRVNLEFKNSKSQGLGIPLPQGKVRVYKEDEADKMLEFIGEDFIDHTPKDEKVRIYLGNAFDIKGERTQISRRKVSDRVREETWEIKLRNHKNTDVKVLIVEKFWGDWEILKYSHPYKKKDANTVDFNVSVPKDKEVIVNYTVSFKW